jgi:hypothetical protein
MSLQRNGKKPIHDRQATLLKGFCYKVEQKTEQQLVVGIVLRDLFF